MRTMIIAAAIVTGLGSSPTNGAEIPPPARAGVVHHPWQVLPNPGCPESRIVYESHSGYESATAVDRVCELPPVSIVQFNRRDLPATPEQPVRHQFAIEGSFGSLASSFAGSGPRVRLVLATENTFWNPRTNGMDLMIFGRHILDVMSHSDTQIYAETLDRLEPGRYGLAVVYDVSTQPGRPLFVLAGLAARFSVE